MFTLPMHQGFLSPTYFVCVFAYPHTVKLQVISLFSQSENFSLLRASYNLTLNSYSRMESADNEQASN